jgi:hypothetical protein
MGWSAAPALSRSTARDVLRCRCLSPLRSRLALGRRFVRPICRCSRDGTRGLQCSLVAFGRRGVAGPPVVDAHRSPVKARSSSNRTIADEEEIQVLGKTDDLDDHGFRDWSQRSLHVGARIPSSCPWTRGRIPESYRQPDSELSLRDRRVWVLGDRPDRSRWRVVGRERTRSGRSKRNPAYRRRYSVRRGVRHEAVHRRSGARPRVRRQAVRRG